MKKSNITKNYIYNLVYQILVIIMPIITTPYLSRVLGAEGMGIYGYDISIVTYFTLLGALGLTIYGQREIAYVQDDRKLRSKIFWELVILRFITVSISVVIFLFSFCIYGENTFYFRILILELLATALDISWFFQGIEEFKKVVIRNFVIKMVSIMLIFLFVKQQTDLWKYFTIYVCSNFLGNATFWIKLRKYIDFIKVKLRDIKKHLKGAIALFVPQIASSIYTVLDKTMLGAIVPDISEVGYYEQSQKIIKLVLTIITTIGIVMVPRIANTYAQGDRKKINEYMRKTFNFIWFFSLPIMFGIIAISTKFVPWFFGTGYEKVADLMMLSSPIIVFISLSTIIGQQYLITTQKQNIRTVAIIIGAVINVVLNLILLKKYASLGAVISTVVAEFMIVFIEVVYIVKNKLLEMRDIFYGCIKYLIVSIVMFLIVYQVQERLPISIMNTFLEVFVGMVVYLVILLIIRDKFLFDNVISKLKKIKFYKKT